MNTYLEKPFYGVCSWWADKLGLKQAKVRLFFIYLTFVSAGSSVLVYLMMAFILDNKEYFKLKFRRKTIWDI